MNQSPTTRLSLLVRLRDVHDRLAWEQFVGLYAPLVYGFARKKGLQDADAADIAQDVLTSVAQQMRQWEFDPQRGTFRGWLFTIARNRLRNWLASPARRINGSGADDHQATLQSQPDDIPDEADWDADYARRIFHWAAAQVREQVSEQTWQAFELTAVATHPRGSQRTLHDHRRRLPRPQPSDGQTQNAGPKRRRRVISDSQF